MYKALRTKIKENYEDIPNEACNQAVRETISNVLYMLWTENFIDDNEYYILRSLSDDLYYRYQQPS